MGLKGGCRGLLKQEKNKRGLKGGINALVMSLPNEIIKARQQQMEDEEHLVTKQAEGLKVDFFSCK